MGPQALGPTLSPLPSYFTFKPFLFLKLWLLLLHRAVVLVPEASLQGQGPGGSAGPNPPPPQQLYSCALHGPLAPSQDPAPDVGLTKPARELL